MLHLSLCSLYMSLSGPTIESLVPASMREYFEMHKDEVFVQSLADRRTPGKLQVSTLEGGFSAYSAPSFRLRGAVLISSDAVGKCGEKAFVLIYFIIFFLQ